MRTARSLLVVAALVAAASFASSDVHAGGTSSAGGGIQWFGTWAQASAEARRSGRPILLVAAAPHCRNISGVW